MAISTNESPESYRLFEVIDILYYEAVGSPILETHCGVSALAILMAFSPQPLYLSPCQVYRAPIGINALAAAPGVLLTS